MFRGVTWTGNLTGKYSKIDNNQPQNEAGREISADVREGKNLLKKRSKLEASFTENRGRGNIGRFLTS